MLTPFAARFRYDLPPVGTGDEAVTAVQMRELIEHVRQWAEQTLDPNAE